MPVLFAPSIAPNAQAAHGVGAFVRMAGLRVGRIRLGVPKKDPFPWPDSASEIKAIITNWTVLERVLAQIEPSLDDDVYIWTAGDAQDEITLDGIAVQADCASQTTEDGGRHGFSHVLDFYRANRLSARPTSLLLQIGDVSIQSRLLSLRLTGQPQTNLVSFSMSFIGAPPPRVRKPA